VIEFEKVKEIGRGARIIWEYFTTRDGEPIDHLKQAAPLLQTIQELRAEKQALGRTVEIGRGSNVAWNLKRAERRFRRLWEENERRPLKFSDRTLSVLARDIVKKKDPWKRDQEEIEEILLENAAPGTLMWNALYFYEDRKRGEPLLIFENLPDEVSQLLREAQQAWRWGLLRSVCAICRAVLEKMIGNLEDCIQKATPEARFDEIKLAARIDLLFSHLEESDFRKWTKAAAHRIRELGNAALHEGALSDQEAYGALRDTVDVVRAILIEIENC
jgi:hypothetical protein